MKIQTMVKTALACGFVLGVALPAMADGPAIPGLGGPTSISGGVFWPTSNNAKFGGNTQFDADLRYHIPADNPLSVPARTILDVGVEAGASHGNHDTIVPITVGEVVSLTGHSPLSSGSFYVGGGIGGYILNQSGLATDGRFGGYVSAGYNFTSSIFAEYKAQWVDNGDGSMLNVGYRF